MGNSLIFTQDWFSNRNKLGQYNFDKSGAIFDFTNTSVSRTLYGNRIKELFEDPRLLETECESMGYLITKNHPVQVTIHNQDLSCYTDGQKIVISGIPLKNATEAGMDIVFGFLSHEAAHIRFTDFFYTKKAAETSPSLKWIWNLIEDEVIEEMLQIEKPGLGNFLCPIKDYMFSKEGKTIFNDDIDEIFYLLFNLIRYPENLKSVPSSIFDKHEKLFEEIKQILADQGVLNISIKEDSTKSNYEAAYLIWKLLQKYIQTIQPSGSGNSGANKQSGDSDDESQEGSNGNSKEQPEKESDEENSGTGSNEESEESDDNSEQSSGSGISEEDAQKMMDNKFGGNGDIESESFNGIKSTTIGDSIGEEFSNSKEDIKNKIQNLSKHPIQASEIHDLNTDYDFDGPRGNAPSKNLYTWIKAKGNIKEYNRLKNEILPHIKLVKNIEIKNIQTNMSLKKEEFQRTGSLDPRCLASAYQSVKNVYQRFGIKYNKEKTKKFSIVLALDESGSMQSRNTRNTVTKLAMIFAEAFRNNPNINLYIYGHSDYVVEYVTPEDQTYEVLTNRYQGLGQNEVESYHRILSEISKKENNNILLINITDSQYLSNYSEIENELKRWDKKIFQSLIVVNDKVTANDRFMNDKIYGKDKWAHVDDIDKQNTIQRELRKLVKHINQLANKYSK